MESEGTMEWQCQAILFVPVVLIIIAFIVAFSGWILYGMPNTKPRRAEMDDKDRFFSAIDSAASDLVDMVTSLEEELAEAESKIGQLESHIGELEAQEDELEVENEELRAKIEEDKDGKE